MRFDVAFVFAILGAVVEALPLTGSNVSTIPVVVVINNNAMSSPSKNPNEN
jgi:hypothetical protein